MRGGLNVRRLALSLAVPLALTLPFATGSVFSGASIQGYYYEINSELDRARLDRKAAAECPPGRYYDCRQRMGQSWDGYMNPWWVDILVSLYAGILGFLPLLRDVLLFPGAVFAAVAAAPTAWRLYWGWLTASTPSPSGPEEEPPGPN